MKTVVLPIPLRLLRAFEFPRKLGICERLFADAIAKNRVCWVRTAPGIPWKLDLAESTHRWIVYALYEGGPFLNWARAFLPADGVIVDAGANIGQMLLYFGQWIPRGRVLAFEPGAHSAKWLEECLQANPELPVELLRMGLGEDTRDAYLKEVGASDLHGSWNQISEAEGQPIKMARLADILAERDISRVDLWELDVEGSKLPALRGARDLLASKQIRSLYVELRGDSGGLQLCHLCQCPLRQHLI